MDKKYLQGYEDLTNEQTLIERLTQRLDNDFEEIKTKYMAKSKEDIYNDSFKLALYGTFGDFLSYIVDNFEEDEDFLTDEQKEQFNSLLAQDKNVLEFLTNCYWNLRHPEYYNIFYSYDDCFTILEDAVKQKEPF